MNFQIWSHFDLLIPNLKTIYFYLFQHSLMISQKILNTIFHFMPFRRFAVLAMTRESQLAHRSTAQTQFCSTI